MQRRHRFFRACQRMKVEYATQAFTHACFFDEAFAISSARAAPTARL